MKTALRLAEQAETLVKTLSGVSALRSVGFLDDETQMDASPSRMPAAWVALDSAEWREGLASVSWAVVLRCKRLAGLKRPAGEIPALDVVEAVIRALHGLRPCEGAKPLAFVKAEYMEPLVESATYLIRFATEIHVGRAAGLCP